MFNPINNYIAMSKNKKAKVVPFKSNQLSPENYVRTHARTLPIHECLITESWDVAGFANVVVARAHKTGNLTIGIYLVDLYCMGLKDTDFRFNIDFEEYNDLKFSESNFVECDYELAHNIIYGGIAYAEDYGFVPAKGFSLTQFILAEDDDSVELVDIEFGLEGKPCFTRGPYDDSATVIRVLATLERTAGPGNFTYIDEPDEDMMDFDDEDYDDEDYDNEEEDEEDGDTDSYNYSRDDAPMMNLQQVKTLLTKVGKAYNEKFRDERFQDKLSSSAIGKGYKITDNQSKVPLDYNTFNTIEQEADYYRLKQLFEHSGNMQRIVKEIKSAIKKYPDTPVFHSLLVTAYAYDHEPVLAAKAIEVMYGQFPKSLFAMTSYADVLLSEDRFDEAYAVFDGAHDLPYLYPDRKLFHNTEAEMLFLPQTRYFIAIDDLDSADLYMKAILDFKLDKLATHDGVRVLILTLAKAKIEKLTGEKFPTF